MSSLFPRSVVLQPSLWSREQLPYHSCILSGSSLSDFHSSVKLLLIGCCYPKPNQTLEKTVKMGETLYLIRRMFICGEINEGYRMVLNDTTGLHLQNGHRTNVNQGNATFIFYLGHPLHSDSP